MRTQNSGSAEIIAFPLRGRFEAASRQADLVDLRDTTRLAKSPSGSSWYHDEAIREEQAKKN